MNIYKRKNEIGDNDTLVGVVYRIHAENIIAKEFKKRDNNFGYEPMVIGFVVQMKDQNQEEDYIPVGAVARLGDGTVVPKPEKPETGRFHYDEIKGDGHLPAAGPTALSEAERGRISDAIINKAGVDIHSEFHRTDDVGPQGPECFPSLTDSEYCATHTQCFPCDGVPLHETATTEMVEAAADKGLSSKDFQDKVLAFIERVHPEPGE